MCVCEMEGKRIWGVFLAFDGQLNAWLVKTAEQNVPRAKGQWGVSCTLRTHTIKVKCRIVVLFIRGLVWAGLQPNEVFLTFFMLSSV